METISFDSGWCAVDNGSDDALWVFTRSDDGHVYAKVADNDPNPTAFGSFFPRTNEALGSISAFIEPIEQMPHFKKSWAKFIEHSDFQGDVEYLQEERGDWKTFTVGNVEIFAKLFIACFPITGHYSDMSQYLYDGFYGLSDDNVEYRDYLSAHDYRELVVGVTGLWRKDIARELHGMTISQLQIINEFSELVTSENLVEAMAESQKHHGQYDFYRGGFQTLNYLQPSIRVRLLKQLLKSDRSRQEDNFISVEDTINMLALVGKHKQFRGCQTWKEVHDTAMKLAPTINGEKIIEFPKIIEEFSKTTLDGYSFKTLAEPEEFVELGDTLDICIGKAGYYLKALRGDSYCFKVLKDDETVAALEVAKRDRSDTWKVVQLHGYRNSELHDKVSLNRFIVDTLNSSNLEKVLERV